MLLSENAPIITPQEVCLKGLSSVYVARLFSTLLELCRTNPALLKRDHFESFAKECIQNYTTLLDYTRQDLTAIFDCIQTLDSNGVPLSAKIEDLSLETIVSGIKAAFTGVLNLSLIPPQRDLWEGLELKEALRVLIKRNPDFDLKKLVEITKDLETL
jgi:hypothetical protein